MAEPDFYLSRRPYADRLVASLLGDGIADYSSGLFLAAPRRTGKSTFLRRDLMPALQSKTVCALYVDLWSDRTKDPAELIAGVLREAFVQHAPPIAKAAKKLGVSKLGFGSFVSFDLDRIGRTDGVTLADALSQLRDKVQCPIALIVDEAQHALSTKAGINAMFGLKAARDSLNQGAGKSARNLLLVFTGSHRDKLTNLVLKRNQPFYGASITNFPLLGRDFTDAFTIWVNRRLAADNQLNADTVEDAFKILGHKPEHLRQVIADVALGEGGAPALDRQIRDKAGALRTRLLEGLEQELAGLTAIQTAVLSTMTEAGDAFAPFTAESLKTYSAKAGKPVEPTDVQAALDSLRKKGLVWKSHRSIYLLEDSSIIEIMRLRGDPAHKG